MNLSVAQLEPTISDEEFAKFCEFFYRKTGIMFEAKKKYFAERRIADRMRKTGATMPLIALRAAQNLHMLAMFAQVEAIH